MHTSIRRRKDGKTDIRKDGKPKTMSLRFSSKRQLSIRKNCQAYGVQCDISNKFNEPVRDEELSSIRSTM